MYLPLASPTYIPRLQGVALLEEGVERGLPQAVHSLVGGTQGAAQAAGQPAAGVQGSRGLVITHTDHFTEYKAKSRSRFYRILGWIPGHILMSLLIN